MDEGERIEQLAELLANAEFCTECFGLVPAGAACPNGCDDIPDEVRHAKAWVQRLHYESQGGWGE